MIGENQWSDFCVQIGDKQFHIRKPAADHNHARVNNINDGCQRAGKLLAKTCHLLHGTSITTLSQRYLSPWLLKLPVLVATGATGPEYRGLRRYRHTAVKAELGLGTEDQRRFRLAELAHPLADIFAGNLLRQIQIVLIVTRLGAQ